MFKKLEVRGKFLGYTFEQPHAFCFFGSRHVGKEDLKIYFPQLDFVFLKQVHGDQVIQATGEQNLEADGHFTTKKGLALVSQSADCIPILLMAENQVCALHAGWRGIAAKIVLASSQKISSIPKTALIGPHIRKASFEVGTDVASKILAAKPEGSSNEEFLGEHSEPGKQRLDLTAIARGQLNTTFPGVEILDTGNDTMTSLDFHSFRRDRDKAGRQYSFVVIKG